MNTTFKKIALVSALMATTAIVTPQMAFAADISGISTASNVYIAPVKDADAKQTTGTSITPVLGYSQKLLISSSAAAPLGNATGATITLYYYDANGAYLGFNDGGHPYSSGTSVTLTGNPLAKKVAIVVSAGSGDTVGSGTYGVINKINALGPNAGPTQVGYTLTPISPTSTDPASIAAAAAAAGYGATIPLDPTYYGPLITSAGKPTDGNSTHLVVAYTSMPLKAAASGTNLASDLVAVDVAGNLLAAAIAASNSDGTFVSPAIPVGNGDTVVQLGGGFNTSDPYFQKIVAAVKPLNNASPKLADLAGNGLAPGQNNVPVNVFAKPKLKSATAPVVVSGVSNNDVADLLNGSLSGTTPLTVTVLFAENLNTSGTIGNDFTSNTSGVTISSVSAGNTPRSLTLTLTGQSANAKWGVSSSGQLTYGGTVVNIQGNYDSNHPLANASPNTQVWGGNGGNGQADALAGVPATPIEIGVAPAPQAYTLDNGHTGLINGASVDFGAPLATVPAATDFSVNTNNGGATHYPIAVTPSLATGSTSKVNLLITNPATTVDWNEDGKVDSSDSTVYNTTYFNTGVFNGAEKYSVALAASPSDTYASIYDPTTGELAKIGSTNVVVGGSYSLFPLSDGASPVLLSTANKGATYQAGTQTLTLTFSEAVLQNNSTGANVGQNILIDNVPLSVFDLNAGVTTAPAATPTNATTLSIAPVAALASTDSVTISTSPASKYGDAVSNPIASSTTGTAISIVNDQPKLINAFLVKDATSGKTTGVVAQYSKPVQANAAGTLDNIFTVRALYGAAGDQYTDFVLPASSVSISGAYVSLTLPAALPSSVGALLVSYNASGNNYLTSTETTGAQQAINGSGPNDLNGNNSANPPVVALNTVTRAKNFAGDADTQYVNGSSNSSQLYSQTLTGTLSGFPQGTLLQAYVVGTAGQFTAGNDSSVSYTTAAGAKVTTQVSLSGYLATTLNAAAAAGTTSVPATLQINASGNNTAVGATLVLQTNANNAVATTSIPVTINTSTGAITGTNTSSGVSGTLTKVNVPSILGDTANIIVSSDTTGSNPSLPFTVSVGVNQTVANGFVQLAYKLPGNPVWQPLYNGDSSLSNYQSFQADINASGKSVALGTISPTNSAVITLKAATAFSNGSTVTSAGDAQWQVVGAPGTVSLVKGASPSVKIDAKPFFTGIDTTTGLPVSVFGTDSTDDEQAFILSANKVASAIDLSNTTLINTLNYASVPANPAFAVQTDLQVSGGTKATAGGPVAIAVPVTGAGTTNLAAGWSLVTASGSNIPAGISAIIQAGNGNQVNTWFRSSTTSTSAPSWLTAGTPVFVYASSAITGFTYFK